MAGKNKSSKVFAIVLLLGALVVFVESSSKKDWKKKAHSKKAFNQFLFVENDDVMLGDEPDSSGDGPDSEASPWQPLPPTSEIDPEFPVDGLPDIDDLLPGGGGDLNWPTPKPPVQPPGGSPCHSTHSCPPVKPPCQSGKPCPPLVNPPCHSGKPCPPPVNPPCHSGKPCPPQVNPPCHSGKPCPPVKPPCQWGIPCPPVHPPCHTGKPCPPVQPPCHTGKACPPAQPPCHPGKPCPPVKPPCQPNRPCNSLSLPPAYSPTKMCGKTYFCRKGFSGPCDRNEVFTSSPSHLSRVISHGSSTCPSHFSPPPGCFSSTHNPFALTAKSSYGYCTIRYVHQPCYGYPSTYRYCKQTKRCYPTMSTSLYNQRPMPGPCSLDQYFTAADQFYGYCRCSRPNYVHCPKSNRCYPAYTKGSCSTGQWLVPNGNRGLSTCKSCPCPSLADGQHVYWNGVGHRNARPGCYKSHTRGPCRVGMRFVVNDILTDSAHCVPDHSGRRRPSSSYDSLLRDWKLFYGNSNF